MVLSNTVYQQLPRGEIERAFFYQNQTFFSCLLQFHEHTVNITIGH